MARLSRGLGVALIYVAMVAILLSGCAREDQPPSQVPSQDIRLFNTEKLSPSENRVEGLALAEFGAQISLNRHRVNIPPDAVKDRTVITIQEPDPRYVVVDYGPEGLRFEKPVEVSIHYGGLDMGDVEEKNLTVYYFDPEKGAWIDMHGKVDTAEEIVMIETDHFSRYALSDHRHFKRVEK